MSVQVRQARTDDARVVEAILIEAASWVDALGEVMWDEDELAPAHIASEVASGQFFIACVGDDPAGVIRFQLEDSLFWPDLPQGESAFVHRLAVSRRYKGQGISDALLRWSIDRARSLGRQHLRLDCDKSRPKLRALYERLGFQFHSYRHVGPYYVARYEYPLLSRSG